MHDLVAPAPTRAQILGFEAMLRTFPPADRLVEHTFGPGFYARTLHLIAGDTLTGKVHATEHIFFVSAGALVVVTEDGRKRVEAGFQAVCPPGRKRVGHALTDCVVTNVHINPTDERDLDKLEAMFIEPDELLEHDAVEVLL